MKKAMLFVLACTQFSVAVFGQVAGSAGQGNLLMTVGPFIILGVIIFLVVKFSKTGTKVAVTSPPAQGRIAVSP
jgi:large-conductance mechanosensitive channel